MTPLESDCTPDWLKVYRTQVYDKGTLQSETVTFSHTPEQFVAELQQREEVLLVARGCCRECVFLPESESFAPKVAVQQMQEAFRREQRLPECQVCAAARHQWQWSPVPTFIVCYGYYYQYWHENRFLRAAKEAGRIEFYEITGLPGCRESGFHFIRFA